MHTPNDTSTPPTPFMQTLRLHGVNLERAETRTLQINTGLLCNLACRHCHLEAGPHRREVMTPEVMEAVVGYAGRVRFATIDVTGGAPELVPGIDRFLAQLAPLTDQLMFRTNLVALEKEPGASLLPVFRDLHIRLVASLPSTSRTQADAQRGTGVWERSCGVLRQLNELGFGRSGSGLELDLAVNPGGAFLAADQAQTEKRYRRELARLGIEFTRLFTFTNVILGRYREWLIHSGNLADYRQMLIDRFNPAALCGVMCRSLISVGWDGILYDCDFNLALGLVHGEHRHHVSEMESRPVTGSAIATGDHCYACTAGAGFT